MLTYEELCYTYIERVCIVCIVCVGDQFALWHRKEEVIVTRLSSHYIAIYYFLRTRIKGVNCVLPIPPLLIPPTYATKQIPGWPTEVTFSGIVYRGIAEPRIRPQPM